MNTIRGFILNLRKGHGYSFVNSKVSRFGILDSHNLHDYSSILLVYCVRTDTLTTRFDVLD